MCSLLADLNWQISAHVVFVMEVYTITVALPATVPWKYDGYVTSYSIKISLMQIGSRGFYVYSVRPLRQKGKSYC